MTIFEVLEIALMGLMVIFAILAITIKKKISAVIFLSVLSMLAVVAFVIMKAPDVAITEAVIGSGLVTALFLFTLFSVKKEGENK